MKKEKSQLDKIFEKDAEKEAEKQIREDQEIQKKLNRASKIVMREKSNKFFAKEKQSIERMGQGVHNGIFYNGQLNAEEDISIITSDRRCFIGVEIKDDFGLNIRHPMEEELIWRPWPNKSVLRFLSKEYNPINIQALFKTIKKINEEFIDHVDKRIHDFVPCDIIADYVNCLFESRGITHICALKGSGKTKQSRIYRELSFNSLWSSRITPAALFRAVEANCGRICIDNFDFCKNEELRAAYSQLLQTGWESDGVSHLCEANTHKVIGSKTYAPYLINNIMGLDETTADRTIKLNMLKTNGVMGKRQPNFRETIWAELREQLRFWALDNWKEVEKTRDVLLNEIDLGNREKDAGLAVLTIAKMVGKDVFESLLSYIKDKSEEAKVRDLTYDWEFILFKEIRARLEKEKEKWIELADIAKAITPDTHSEIERVLGHGEHERENPEYNKAVKKMMRWVPKHLSKVPLFGKKRLVKGRTQIYFILEEVKKYMTLKELDREDYDPTKKEAKKK